MADRTPQGIMEKKRAMKSQRLGNLSPEYKAKFKEISEGVQSGKMTQEAAAKMFDNFDAEQQRNKSFSKAMKKQRGGD